MAYRFNGTTDKIRFDIGPLSGYTAGAITIAFLFKRASLGGTPVYLNITTSADADRIYEYLNANAANFWRGGSGTSSGSFNLNSTTAWYILAVTCGSPSAAPRLHLYDGTSWAHNTPSGGGGATDITMAGTDRIWFCKNSGFAFSGDLVCAGIKKANASDAALETLTTTGFPSWTAFGFEWLAGFEASGTVINRTTPGSGDEAARTGTTVVSDPPGWVWAPAVVPVADFTGTPLTGTAPLSVAFTDSSTNTPTSWLWNFGDGSTSTSQNPTHSYTTSGVYTVALTATNATGSNTRTRTAYITASETVALVAGGGVTIW